MRSQIPLTLSALPWLVTAAQRPLRNPSSSPPYRTELLSLHRSLVSIESITGNEAPVGRFLEQYLSERGYTVTRQRAGDAKDERFNVLARPGGHVTDTSRPKVVVSSHIDVVPPYIPYDISSSENIDSKTVIKGRGSVDAKASVAAMIVALEQLRATGSISDEDAALVFVVGEEVDGAGMRAYARSLGTQGPPPAVIFGEPTENKLACGHKGILLCRVSARGTPGHSGYPWLGKSANAVMVRAMAALLDTDLGSSARFGNTTVNIGRFEGGVAANVIAGNATVQLAVRVAVGSEEDGSDTVRRSIEAVLRRVDEEALSMTCGDGYGPIKCNCDVAGFDTVVVNYGTDIGHLKGNYTKYLYGPGSILVAHGARENLTVGDLETAVEGYKDLILHSLSR
ncbi:acetylornithine deacetylase [Ophiocordyceps camponoti-floridani]|uniref:Acetylornithine deacetylase n=1 Tax=Ophiocordyceps camponoti-floridani TaxID=2030778 RepID=A0A8H4VBS9_9HYPO|nr:acetylornithine deacetylase [Ophiocordyceps camponoti-floridani]